MAGERRRTHRDRRDRQTGVLNAGHGRPSVRADGGKAGEIFPRSETLTFSVGMDKVGVVGWATAQGEGHRGRGNWGTSDGRVSITPSTTTSSPLGVIHSPPPSAWSVSDSESVPWSMFRVHRFANKGNIFRVESAYVCQVHAIWQLRWFTNSKVSLSLSLHFKPAFFCIYLWQKRHALTLREGSFFIHEHDLNMTF